MDRENIGLFSGLAVFFLGVGLLAFTFYMAYTAFTNPSILSNFAELAPKVEGKASEIIGPIVEIIPYLIAALLLWVMGSISGRIAKHGLSLFSSRTKKEEKKVKKTDTQTEESENSSEKPS